MNVNDMEIVLSIMISLVLSESICALPLNRQVGLRAGGSVMWRLFLDENSIYNDTSLIANQKHHSEDIRSNSH
jgi:hypothetical protein